MVPEDTGVMQGRQRPRKGSSFLEQSLIHPSMPDDEPWDERLDWVLEAAAVSPLFPETGHNLRLLLGTRSFVLGISDRWGALKARETLEPNSHRCSSLIRPV